MTSAIAGPIPVMAIVAALTATTAQARRPAMEESAASRYYGPSVDMTNSMWAHLGGGVSRLLRTHSYGIGGWS